MHSVARLFTSQLSAQTALVRLCYVRFTICLRQIEFVLQVEFEQLLVPVLGDRALQGCEHYLL